MSLPTQELTGASLVFTSSDPVIQQSRAFIEKGELAAAEKHAVQSGGSTDACEELAQIIERIRVEYGSDARELLERIRKFIPDVTAQDLARWTAAGQVQCRMLDGRRQYFRREPSNIFRFCPEAIARRILPETPAPQWTLEAHLARVVGEARETGHRQVVPLRHRVRYTLTIPPGAAHVRKGALLRAWLPFPQEYRQQQSVRLISASPSGAQVAPSASGEFPLSGAPQRTVYFEQHIERAGDPLVFEEVFEFTSSAWYPLLDDAMALPLPQYWHGGSLNQRPPHIVFTRELSAIVAKLVGGATNPLSIARAIFHWIADNITYHAEEEYSIIPSLTDRALSTRRGDCGVQTMLFITMCRRAGIPARWQSGWQTKRVDWNMHDWCEIYVQPWGWLPMDPSYGLIKSDDPAIRDFYFGHQDSYRLIVNRDYGSTLFPAKQSLRSELLDFQRGEVEIDGRNLYFPHWDYRIEFEWLDEGP